MRRLLLGGGLACLISGVALGESTSIFSLQNFPDPYSVIEGFTSAEFTDYTITANGYYSCSTGITGNVDAPLEGSCMSLFSSNAPVTLSFEQPVYYVGISAADGDFTVDTPAEVVLQAFGPSSELLGTTTQYLDPAESLSEQNAGAVFLGIESNIAIYSVQVYSTVSQSTTLDNLVFDEIIVEGDGCSSTGSAGSAGFVSSLALLSAFALRRRKRW